ncbi:hypothetical protein CH366_02580 [Leptospira harrisiae]|uniref:Uncharacterized protein n=1 Tax=Leptospira harrisiae TaxID=2023189 RepID=A0A2N0ALI0_9LEPT|nr:hypothetical protein CH364_02440 [Leptospira harrisiae]PKA08678.1 hypothetical protein CH366_02580 [Leptospira harrisiae]
MGYLILKQNSSDRKLKNSTLCPKDQKFPFSRFSLLGFIVMVSTFFSVGCVSLLPVEQRMYPMNPIILPERAEILLPCIDEFLETPQTKD